MVQTTLSFCAAIALGLAFLVRITCAISDQLDELFDGPLDSTKP